MAKLCIKVLSSVHGTIFNNYQEHMYDHDVDNNHIVNLIKIISFNYCKNMLYHQGECMNRYTNKFRNKLNKTIGFLDNN